MAATDTHVQREVTESERDWLRIRRYLIEHRHDMSVTAAGLYPNTPRVAGTPLLTASAWMPPTPIALDRIALAFAQETTDNYSHVVEGYAGLPLLPNGQAYRSYAEAIRGLAAPTVFENRSTYRLLDADISGGDPRLTFGRGTYFDGINTGEACAHEYAAHQLGMSSPGSVRETIGDPCDPHRRPTNVAISTLTLRHDRETDDTRFYLHWRDPAKVGHAGGLYQVLPVGIFQASGRASWNESNDFDLWRCMVREFAEELLGASEDYDSEQTPIDYENWSFAAEMTRALGHQVRTYYLGMGVDPLTLATDLLTVAVIDASLFDAQFGALVADNAEGRVLQGLEFTAGNVDRFVHHEPTQAAGAALLSLAWQHKDHLFG